VYVEYKTFINDTNLCSHNMHFQSRMSRTAKIQNRMVIYVNIFVHTLTWFLKVLFTIQKAI